MDRDTYTDAHYGLNEALKRNDTTYARIKLLLEALPVGDGPEADLRQAIADAEAQQQTLRKTLIRARRLLEAERPGAD